MSEFMKGNFTVKRPVEEKIETVEDGKAASKAEFRRKAIQSVGGSMVFVEMDQLYWDDEAVGDVQRES
jgi:hypothetical protein